MSEWSGQAYGIAELGREVADQGRGIVPSTESITVDDEGVAGEAAPLIDRFGDDRFADNILRAADGLPQHGDAEEEEAAAEEGALIEASGYPDPASDPRWA